LLLLELQRELDRETRDFYVFNISAADGGDPPRFGYSTVHVHVLDTNDNAPKFERSHYEVFVSPNSLDEINHQLVTVHARDADSGRNGRISYRLSGAGAGGEEQFGIWTENGTIFAKVLRIF
uniref:CA domain-containing protein n=1 Tax=Anisakis simplex TaxID=6269 RepID=A0A0M3JEY7_ANISI